MEIVACIAFLLILITLPFLRGREKAKEIEDWEKTSRQRTAFRQMKDRLKIRKAAMLGDDVIYKQTRVGDRQITAQRLGKGEIEMTSVSLSGKGGPRVSQISEMESYAWEDPGE